MFVSFAAEDRERVKRLLPQLCSKDYDLDLYEGSPAEDGGEISDDSRRTLGEKIVESCITLCLITEKSHASALVNSALNKSRNKGSRIIAMALKGVKWATLPDVIKEENLTFYPWDPKKFRRLIDQE
ncbi:TIR domain-containing protein [Candidatus Omnitrophota bacterium]